MSEIRLSELLVIGVSVRRKLISFATNDTDTSGPRWQLWAYRASPRLLAIAGDLWVSSGGYYGAATADAMVQISEDSGLMSLTNAEFEKPATEICKWMQHILYDTAAGTVRSLFGSLDRDIGAISEAVPLKTPDFPGVDYGADADIDSDLTRG